MTAPTVPEDVAASRTWTWDSLTTTVHLPGIEPLKRHRVLTTNLGEAVLWAERDPGAPLRTLTGVTGVEPDLERSGWLVTGFATDTGLQETWYAEAVSQRGGCGPCGRR